MERKVKLLLGLLAVAMLAGMATGAAYAAASNPVAPMTSQATGFDPYTLKAYVVGAPSDTVSMELSMLLSSRPPIRIPFRPELRSPFRPNWLF